MEDSFQRTEIVQLPAILMSGKISIELGYKELPEAVLKQTADFMGGTLIYKKVRATYTTCENELCVRYNCWEKLPCSKHPEQ